MNISAPFIFRPIATVLLTLGLIVIGAIAYYQLPVASLPGVSSPTISVSANLSGADPDTMASTVATPLERSLGQISGIDQITSTSSDGSTSIRVKFNYSKDINVAAREVQAAINAAQSLLPSGMTSRPSYQKSNTSDVPIFIMALDSSSLSQAQLYQLADQQITPLIKRVEGVGSVEIGGSSDPAIRVGLDPQKLQNANISLDSVRDVIKGTNSNLPKGTLNIRGKDYHLGDNSQLFDAAAYRSLIITSKNGGREIIHLGDVADIEEGVEDPYNTGFLNNHQAVLLLVRPSADANMVQTIDSIRSRLPQVNQILPDGANLNILYDRAPSVRESLTETQMTLLLGVLLVVAVIFVFLRSLRATIVPALTIPVTLIATFAVIYTFGYSLNTLTLMSLIVSIGFIVDDAIVVVENIARHVEEGAPPFKAALAGSREITPTVISMSLSLVAVLGPLLFLPGLVGKLFASFSVTMAATILISMVISLTLSPMLSAWLLKPHPSKDKPTPAWQRFIERIGALSLSAYRYTLGIALRHRRLTLLSLLGVIVLNGYLFVVIPKSMMPEQDTGRIQTTVTPDQSLSFSAMQQKIKTVRTILLKNPNVKTVMGFIGAGGPGGGGGGQNVFMLITLKDNRSADTQTVSRQLTQQLGPQAGLQISMSASGDIGGSSSGGQYTLALRSDNLESLNKYAPKVTEALSHMKEITDVQSDASNNGQALSLKVNRDKASRLGIDMNTFDTLLGNSFAQSKISSVYQGTNQYYVVMSLKEKYRQDPDILSKLYITNSAGKTFPISAFARVVRSTEPVSVHHINQFASTSIDFNLADNVPLGTALTAVRAKVNAMMLPGDIIPDFNGSAEDYQKSQSSMPWLLLGAIVAVYLVLGILYESYIHPLTILSTLPSAGIGALLALELLNMPLSAIAMIGIVLLIGVVKKNAILLVDFALEVERREGRTPLESITQAALVRFRPIMMTTLAAILGAIPLVIGSDENAQLRAPLGITIIGGLIVSQVLTLYTTPVVYLYLDKLRRRR